MPILAGLAFLREIEKPDFYSKLRSFERQLQEGIDSIITDHDLEMVVPHRGARFGILLRRGTPPLRYEDTFCHDRQRMLSIYRECAERGVYFHDYGGGPIHHNYSIQHTRENIDQVLNVLDEVLPAVLRD